VAGVGRRHMSKNRSTGTVVTSLAAAVVTLLLPYLAYAQDQTTAGDAEAGRQKNSMCVGCHEIPGYKSSFPSVYHVPRIIGQSAGYIAAALHEYRSGNRNHPTMTVVAEGLSDRDIADLAAYYGSR